MKDILIIGTGGLGREVYGILQKRIEAGANWNFKGFLDDNLNALDNYNYPKVISTIKDYEPKENEFCLLSIASPKTKKAISESLLQRGAKFETLIHPLCSIGPNVTLGAGLIIYPFVSITCDSTIGDFVTINSSCSIGHDTSIGNFSTLSTGCDITGNVKLGEGVFLASNVTTIPKSKIGDYASIGINSFVAGKLKGEKSYLGNPATPLF